MSEVLTPKSIETKSGQGKKGPWTLYRVEFTDGTKASTFDSKTATFIQANYGKPVNVEISQTEKGKDLLGAWPLDGAQPPIQARISVEKKSGDDYMRPRNPGESRLIAKQACLKAAVELVVAKGTAKDVVGDVLATADRFIDWVFQEDGVRHIKAEHTSADVAAEREAVLNDVPADQLTKDLVVGMIPTANADAKAILKSYGLATVKDVQARLTKHGAELFLELNGVTRKEAEEIPF